MSELQYLEVEAHDAVALVRLNRPEVMNALCQGLMDELAQTLQNLGADDAVAVIVLTGNDKAFAAGADITEMKDSSYQYMLEDGGLTGTATVSLIAINLSLPRSQVMHWGAGASLR